MLFHLTAEDHIRTSDEHQRTETDGGRSRFASEQELQEVASAWPMKRAKGATLAEIMQATGWQKHTVRGFVSVLGSKGGEQIESSKNPAGERTYKIGR